MASATRALSLLSSLLSFFPSFLDVCFENQSQSSKHTTVQEVMRALFEEIFLFLPQSKFFTQDNKYVPLSFGFQW